MKRLWIEGYLLSLTMVLESVRQSFDRPSEALCRACCILGFDKQAGCFGSGLKDIKFDDTTVETAINEI